MTKRLMQLAIKNAIDAFNETMDTHMRIEKPDNNAEWYTLYVSNVRITSGTEEHILKRIKGINRENGV